MSPKDHPELDDTPLYTLDQASRYRSLIGSANWIVTLGRFDIAFALQSLTRFNMAPRLGHLDCMLRVFSYLKTRPDGKIICDTSLPDHSKFDSVNHDNWKDFYPDAEDELSPDQPTAYGRPVQITCYVDADHAHCRVTRRSTT